MIGKPEASAVAEGGDPEAQAREDLVLFLALLILKGMLLILDARRPTKAQDAPRLGCIAQ